MIRYIFFHIASAVEFIYRRLTARYRVVPQVFVLGAPKCGTTTLFEIVRRHPGYMPLFMKAKELDFLQDIPNHSPRPRTVINRIAEFLTGKYSGVNSYKKFFPLRSQMESVRKRQGTETFTSDFSVSYLYCPVAAKRILEIRPDAKLIIMIRNPVERAYSEYTMLYKTKHAYEEGKQETRTFEEAIEDELNNVSHSHYFMETYLRRGIYEHYIRMYYSLFDKRQIMIIRSEDFFADIKKVASEVFTFLSLPADNLDIDYEGIFKNQGKYTREMKDETRSLLEKYFESHNKSLGEFLGVQLNWERKQDHQLV